MRGMRCARGRWTYRHVKHGAACQAYMLRVGRQTRKPKAKVQARKAMNEWIHVNIMPMQL